MVLPAKKWCYRFFAENPHTVRVCEAVAPQGGATALSCILKMHLLGPFSEARGSDPRTALRVTKNASRTAPEWECSLYIPKL